MAMFTFALAHSEVSAANEKLTPRSQPTTVNIKKAKVNDSRRPAKSRIVENGWHSAGTGVWFEGLLTIFDQIDYDLSWEIEIEESDEVAGYYRFIPYREGSPVATAVGAADHEYFYVDASDPERVWCEPFIAYKDFEFNYWFEQLVPENYWYDEELYGTLEDNVIYFPKSSFAWYAEEIGQFLPVNNEGDFKIVLPGGEVRPNWNTLGESEFIDGFCGPYFKGEAISTTVTVQERDRQPGYYRLLGAFSQYGSNNPLIIDATNPDFVTVPYQETGFTHDERGTVVVYSHCENFISPTKYSTTEEYAEAFPQYVATYKEGKIVFPPDACVLHFPDWNPLSFTTNDENARESSVTIPKSGSSGITTIERDEHDTSVTYYNLYGYPVENPGPGFYIKHQCGKSSKILIR